MTKGMDKTWGIFNLDADIIFFRQIGDSRIWIKRVSDEIYIANSHNKEESKLEYTPKPDDAEWSRWVISEKSKSIELSPLFPDRPIVVKTESTFYLPENAEKTVFVRVPMWIAVNSIGEDKVLLLDTPSVVLSNTWFGDFKSGELCYWISSGARARIEPDTSRPYMAICPVSLYNKSHENLLVEKFYLRVPNLSLFLYREQLWSDKVTINYKGKNEVSQVVFTGKPIKSLSNAIKVADPRRVENKNIFTKSFASITGIWGSDMH